MDLRSTVQLFAEAALRTVDILGLFAFMLGGLGAVRYERPLGLGLARAMRWTEVGNPRLAKGAVFSARAMVVLFGAWTAGVCSLAAMDVLSLRPGPNPGAPATNAAGAIGLGALVLLLVRAAVTAFPSSSDAG